MSKLFWVENKVILEKCSVFKQPNRLGNSTELNSGEEGVILPQLGIFEVFRYKSELQPGVLTIFWLFVDRPVSKSLQRVFLMFYLFYFIFPLFQDLS